MKVRQTESIRLTVLTLVWAGLCSAQDPRAIVARAIAVDDRSNRLARDYTYKVRDEIRELDDRGAVKTVHSTVDEVLYIAGKRYLRPVMNDDKPVSDREAHSEQVKIDRAAAEASRLTPAEHEKRITEAEQERVRQRAQFKDIPDAYDFTLLGEAMIEGRPVWKIQAQPRSQYRGSFRGMLQHVEGTLWIDKQEGSWVRVDADVLEPISLGWFLARVAAGTRVSFEMMRVNGELWAPKKLSLRASARFALLKKVNAEEELTFSDYRKFQTDAQIVTSDDPR
jgi:negative regulator of sigma E activity